MRLVITVVACTAVVGAGSSRSQVPLTWESMAMPGQSPSSFIPVGQYADHLVAHDDGGGPALYFGGGLPQAGPSYVGRWDGQTMTNVSFANDVVDAMTIADTGTGPTVHVMCRQIGLLRLIGGNFALVSPALDFAAAMAGFDSATGPELFVAGNVSGQPQATHRWNGLTFVPLPTLSPVLDVRRMAVIDDGAGPRLFVVGRHVVMGESLGLVATWDGSSWNVWPPLRVTSPSPGSPGTSAVNDISFFDDGTGPSVFVGGRFDEAAGVPMTNVARWDGNAWAPVGSGVPSRVLQLTVHDAGAGRRLFAGSYGGALDSWNGQGWEVRAPVSFPVLTFRAMESFDDGGGADLVVSGLLAGAVSRTCLDSGVGAAVGVPEPVLGVALPGGPVTSPRSFDVGVNQPFEFHVAQPSLTTAPSAFHVIVAPGFTAGNPTTTMIGDLCTPIPPLGNAGWLVSVGSLFPALTPGGTGAVDAADPCSRRAARVHGAGRDRGRDVTIRLLVDERNRGSRELRFAIEACDQVAV